MMTQEMSVLIFAKAPVPGEVKTRLIPAIGEGRAAALQGMFIIEKIKTCIHANIGPVQLWCAPDTNHTVFQKAAEEYEILLQQQAEGNLGYKMLHACMHTLKSSSNVILVGTDCPGIDAAYLQQARQALLNGNEVVIGPAHDGGYVLIGLRNPLHDSIAEIFSGIHWSSAAVLQQTRDKLKQQQINWKELSPLVDIDRPEDLMHLDAETYGVISEDAIIGGAKSR